MNPKCETCDREIVRRTKWSNGYFATRRWCDRKCQIASRPDIGSDFIVTATGCWEWQGHIDRNGYGKAYDPNQPKGRRLDWAHRVSYRNHRGDIPAGHHLDHLCENPTCINPNHLDAVTPAEHAFRTMNRLGRPLTVSKAATLRQAGLTYAEIADAMHLAGKESAFSMVKSAIDLGLVDPDSLPVTRVLDEADREDIKILYALGVPQPELAAWYRVDNSSISRAITGSRRRREHAA